MFEFLIGNFVDDLNNLKPL